MRELIKVYGDFQRIDSLEQVLKGANHIGWAFSKGFLPVEGLAHDARTCFGGAMDG